MLLFIITEYITPLFVTIIALYAVKELLSYKSIQFYKRQGSKVSVIYFPLIGIYNHYILRRNSKDQLEEIKQILKENSE